jgi:hypothetical protein
MIGTLARLSPRRDPNLALYGDLDGAAPTPGISGRPGP